MKNQEQSENLEAGPVPSGSGGEKFAAMLGYARLSYAKLVLQLTIVIAVDGGSFVD